MERWRTSVQTVGRCLTDCRHRCSPSQNLTEERPWRCLKKGSNRAPGVELSRSHRTRDSLEREKPGSSSRRRHCLTAKSGCCNREPPLAAASQSILTSEQQAPDCRLFPAGYEPRRVFIALQMKFLGLSTVPKQLVLNDV